MNYSVRILHKPAFAMAVLFVLLMNGRLNAQSQADSLEIYDPFLQREKIDYILDTYFSLENVPDAPRIDQLNKALEQIQKTNNKKKIAEHLKIIAEAYLRTDNNNMALQYFFRALRMAEEAKDSVLRGVLNLRIGAIYPMTESPFETNYMERGIDLLKNVQDESIRAIIEYGLARTETDPVKSDSLTKLAIYLQRKVVAKNPKDTTALENLSKYLNGMSLFDEAMAIAEKAGSTRLLIIYINNRGMMMYLEKRYNEALFFYMRALKLCKAARMKGLMKNTYHNLSMVYASFGDFKNSSKYLQLHVLTRENQLKENNARHYIENIVKYEVEAREVANALLTLEKGRLERGLFSARVLEAFLIVGLLSLIVMFVIVLTGRNKLRRANDKLMEQRNELNDNRQQIEFAHKELQVSEANLRAAQELALVANWEWNITGNKFSYSEMLPILFGVSETEQALSLTRTLFPVIHPFDRRKVWKKVMKTNWQQGEYESMFRITRNNELRWMQMLYKCVVNPFNKSARVYGTIQDVTLQREKEDTRIKIEAERLFTQELINQQEVERKRIAFEIHDGIGQDIVALKNQAELALTDSDPPRASEQYLHAFVESVPEMLNALRRISRNLHPVHLERMGLTETIIDTIRQTENRTSINFLTKIDNVDNLLSIEYELHIFRIVQELMSNIVKHSRAQNVIFELQKRTDFIELIMRDDGKGFILEERQSESMGFGLQSLANRSRILGSILSVVTAENQGTSIKITIPLGKRNV